MNNYAHIDRLPVDRIRDIQLKLFVDTVQYASGTSVFYKRRFSDIGIQASHLRSIEDTANIPFTTKEDIQKDNRSFFAAPETDIAEIVSTTGTTGNPVFVALTAKDLDRLAVNEEKSFGYAGAVKEDVFNIAVTCDNLFIAGMAYYRGLSRIGASVIRTGPQNILRQIDIMRKLKPTGIVAVPSFMVHLARRVEENGGGPAGLGLKKIVLIGDSIRDSDFNTNSLGRIIESAFGRICYSTYGITEAQVSFCECCAKQGLHSHPDLVFAEIVDDDGRPLPDGETGELVLTTFGLEGMPLIRYKTGDIAFKMSAPCGCGRTSLRIGPVLGRKQQKLKVKGVTLYPKNIENAVLGLDGVVNYQVEAHTGDDMTDRVILRIGSYDKSSGFRAMLKDAVLAKARVTPDIEIELPEDIEKRLYEGGSRKAVTFSDKRKA